MLGCQKHVVVAGDICRQRFKKSYSMMHVAALTGELSVPRLIGHILKATLMQKAPSPVLW